MAVEVAHKYDFFLEIDGMPGCCAKVKPPKSEKAEAQYGAGSSPNIKEAGKATIGDCEFEVLTNRNTYFEDWHKNEDKRLVFLKLTDKNGKVTKKWEMSDCWVKAVEPPELDLADDGKDLLMTKVTLSVGNLVVTGS